MKTRMIMKKVMTVNSKLIFCLIASFIFMSSCNHKLNHKILKSDSLSYKYDLDGEILSIVEYADGEQNGVSIYFGSEGIISDFIYYEAGEQDGLAKHFFSSGKINYICEYKHDRLYNIFLVKDSLGNKLDFGEFKNGNGKVRKFYENGKLKEVGEFKNGCRHGKWTRYSEKGDVMNITEFENGVNKEMPDLNFCFY